MWEIKFEIYLKKYENYSKINNIFENSSDGEYYEEEKQKEILKLKA